jgi:hypothetical protein
MKYELRTKVGKRSRLYRYSKLVKPKNGHPTNAEFEFWTEIERLREILGFIHKETGEKCDCDPEAIALKGAGLCSWCWIRAATKATNETKPELKEEDNGHNSPATK